jgi:hypothetical protein
MRNWYFVACFLSVFLSGCIEPALSGQAREDYLKNIKPELYYWHKAGISEEQKIRDWIGCCGKADGTFPGCKLEKKDGETSLNPAWYRLNDKKNSCMTNKGYGYGSQYKTKL